VASFAADQADYEITSARQAFRSTFELAICSGTGFRTNEWTPADGESDGYRKQDADDEQNFPEFFHPSPQAKDLWNAVGIPYKYFEMEMRGP